jgi:DNA-directed RNA polymerase specialized sigma24 family protein
MSRQGIAAGRALAASGLTEGCWPVGELGAPAAGTSPPRRTAAADARAAGSACGPSGRLEGGLCWSAVSAWVRSALAANKVAAGDRDEVGQEVMLRLLQAKAGGAHIRDLQAYVRRVAAAAHCECIARDRRRARTVQVLHPHALCGLVDGWQGAAWSGAEADGDAVSAADACSLPAVARTLGAQAQEVVAAWQACGTVKGAARQLWLDVRQVKRICGCATGMSLVRSSREKPKKPSRGPMLPMSRSSSLLRALRWLLLVSLSFAFAACKANAEISRGSTSISLALQFDPFLREGTPPGSLMGRGTVTLEDGQTFEGEFYDTNGDNRPDAFRPDAGQSADGASGASTGSQYFRCS